MKNRYSEETVHLPKVKCNDINVCYEVQGKGFPLVMIMGLSANMDWWDPKLVEETSKKYKTVVFDNRGAGRTDAPKIDYSIKMFADDTEKLMDSLKIQKAHVLGISMGGMIAQEFALTYPQRVEKLVLCSTNCGASKSVPPAPKILNLLMGGASGTSEDIIKNTIPILFTEDFIKSNPDIMKVVTERLMKAPIAPDAFTRQVKAIMAWDTYARLPKIKAPTLVMHGKKDILVPPENAKILADRIPGAKLAYFEKSAHALFSQETDKVVDTLLKFLA
jgi:pimeloyl-ACP methyl ester carboxylesterase